MARRLCRRISSGVSCAATAGSTKIPSAPGCAFFFGPARPRRLAAEIRAQFEGFHATGLALDHVNAHKHMHLHPTVARLMVETGREYGMRAVRVPAEPGAVRRG